MADIKRKFRAEDGLDAGGDKIVNVALADRTVGTDGVNVDFLVQENTVQVYDSTRGYNKGFVVLYDNRLYQAINDIVSPSGAFNLLQWRAVRTDAQWITVASGTYQLSSGESISVNTGAGNDMVFTLPNTPVDGDTVVLADIGGRTGTVKVQINASVQSILNFRGEQVRTVLMTRPRSQLLFVFSNRLWQMYITDYGKESITVTPATPYQAQANDFIVRRFTSAAPINITLPRNANNGDIISLVDLDGLNPLYHTIVKTFDDTTSIGEVGTHIAEGRNDSDAFFVFDASNSLWRIWEGDQKSRLRIIRADSNIRPNEEVLIFGTNNATAGTINLTLPSGILSGDTVKISMNYMRKGQTVKIKAAEGDTIASSVALLQFPKRSEYPPDAQWVSVTELEFNGTTSYVPVLELAYIEDTVAGTRYWVVQQNVPTVERVDAGTDATRARLGVIALATQAQANVDLENTPAKEVAITPETLANRTATEARRGIAKIATTAQVNQNSTATFVDDTIVTPKKLNERTATETRRGLAEIATQAETDAGLDDTTIITPKKLQARQGSETLSGIVKYVSTNSATPAETRGAAGTNVYNKTVNNLTISPKALDQYKATYAQQGAVILAIDSEVIAGQSQAGYSHAVVTPETLHKKTSTDGRIGLIEIATQAETDAGTDYTRAVTPKTLNDRKATETLTGIARIGTQVEFDAGVLDNVISTPLKIKTRFDNTARTSVSAASGLVESGTLWNHYTLDIREASNTQRGTARLATQTEVNTGTDDKTIITPLKLQAKKATENAEGIIQLATQAEVIDGTVSNKAFSPKHYKYIVQQEKSWEATSARRGYVKLTTGTATWEGDDTNGSVANLAKFEDNGFAISPLQMNTALTHYLPIKGKAFDSDKLDGFDSAQFIRRDIAQDINANMTFKQPVRIESTLTVTGVVNLSSSITSNNTTLTGSTTINSNSTVGALNYIEFTSLSQGSGTWTSQHDSNVKAPVFLNITTPAGASRYVPLIKQRYKDGTFTFGTLTNEPTSNDEGAFVLHYIDEVKTQHKWTFRRNGDLEITAGNFVLGNGSAVINGGLNVTKASGITTTGLVASAASRFDGSVVINNTLTVRDHLTSNGGLTVNSRIRSQGTKPADLYSRKPNADNTGFWSVDVNDEATYSQFPGYFKMVEKTNEVTGLPYLERGEEVKSPGTLTQFGNTLDSLYQDWITYPTTPEARTTRWTRTWQKTKNSWSSFVQVFDGGNPPQPSDIGALPSDNAIIGNLTIRDFLRIGNVRIIPDPVNKSVKFEWIE